VYGQIDISNGEVEVGVFLIVVGREGRADGCCYIYFSLPALCAC